MAILNQLPQALGGKNITFGNNMHNSATDVNNSYVDSNSGRFIAYSGWKRTDYIEVEEGQWYAYVNLGSSAQYVGYYDANRNPIYYGTNYQIYQAVRATTLETYGFMKIPSGVKYFIFSGTTTETDNFELRKVIIE